MYNELAEKLININSRSKGDLLKEAALAITTLEEQLRQMTVERDVLAKKLKSTEEALETAIDDMEYLVGEGRGNFCDYCALKPDWSHCRTIRRNCKECSHNSSCKCQYCDCGDAFRWQGPVEDDEEEVELEENND